MCAGGLSEPAPVIHSEGYRAASSEAQIGTQVCGDDGAQVSEAVNRYSTTKGSWQAAIMIARSPQRNRRRIMTIPPLSMLCAFAP